MEHSSMRRHTSAATAFLPRGRSSLTPAMIYGSPRRFSFPMIGLVVHLAYSKHRTWPDPRCWRDEPWPPLVFASSAFVPVSSMPGWLQAFARHQPVSVTVSAVRDLVLGTPVASDLLQALAWMAGIVLVFAPLAVRRYRRA